MGEKRGLQTGRLFTLRRCRDCGFAFAENPWPDGAQIYNAADYEGKGADPFIECAYAQRSELPIASENDLRTHESTFDVMTANEVIEHMVDPLLSMLSRIHRLLRPGGWLFLTTGNAEPLPRTSFHGPLFTTKFISAPIRPGALI